MWLGRGSSGFRQPFRRGKKARWLNSFLQQLPNVAAPALATFPPVGIPVRAVRTRGTSRLPALDPLAAKTHFRFRSRAQSTRSFEPGSCQNKEAPKLVLVEFFDRLDEIPVKRHRLLRYLEGCEQAGGGAVIGERPSQRRCHPVGMKGAQWVTLTGTERSNKIVEPHGPVVVVEGKNGGTGSATANARLDHGLNLERETEQNKDLIRLSDPGVAQSPPHPARLDVSFEHGDGIPVPIDDHHRWDFADTGRSKQIGIPLIWNLPDDLIGGMGNDRIPSRNASVAVG